MLHAGVAVGDHRHIVLKERAAFGHNHHAELTRRLEHLLALIAPGLVVALDRKGPHGLHPAQVLSGVIQAIYP